MKSLLEVLRHPKRCYAQWGLYPVTGDSGNKFHEGKAPEGVIRVIEGTGTPTTQSCVGNLGMLSMTSTQWPGM